MSLKHLTQLQALRKPSEVFVAAVLPLWPGLGCQEEGGGCCSLQELCCFSAPIPAPSPHPLRHISVSFCSEPPFLHFPCLHFPEVICQASMLIPLTSGGQWGKC